MQRSSCIYPLTILFLLQTGVMVDIISPVETYHWWIILLYNITFKNSNNIIDCQMPKDNNWKKTTLL